jgi:hypothetical protein
MDEKYDIYRYESSLVTISRSALLETFTLADFILPEQKRSEDWEYYRRNVFELIQEFIRKVK